MDPEAEEKCFVCLNTGGNLNIFTTYNICNDKEELYVEVIKNCFSIEIGQDSGLNAMCTDCSIKLRRAYTFKNDIIEAVNKLVVLQDAVADDTDYSKLQYLNDTFENDYNIKTVLNPETGQISYTLDKINEIKEPTNDQDTYLIDLENDVIITKKQAEIKVRRTKQINENDVVKENLTNNVQNEDEKLKGKNKETETVEVVQEKITIEKNMNDNRIIEKMNKRTKRIITINGDLVNAPCDNKETKSSKKPKKVKNAKKPKFTVELGQTKCSLCSTQFETNKALRVHMNTHYPDYNCGECGVAFASQQRLRNHVNQIHNVEESLDCKYCDKSFTNVNTRNAHMWRVHTKPDPYKCAQCGERFKTYLKRLRHMQSAHVDSVAEYPCQYCDKKFAYAAYRTKHVRTMHLEARPYKCRDCTYSFARRRELDAHRASKHGDGEAKYQCNVCSKKFYFSSALKLHRNLHEKFTCAQCNAKFSDVNQLDAHHKTHEPFDQPLDHLPILDPVLHLDDLTDYTLDSFWVLGPEM